MFNNSNCIPIPSLMLTAGGIAETIDGSLDIGNGNILMGVKKTFLGLSATNLGIRGLELGYGAHPELLKYSLGLGGRCYSA